MIRQQRAAQDFAARFGRLSRKREEASTYEDFAELYIELTGWHINLEEAGERGLLDTVQSLMTDLRSDFGRWVGHEYPRWLRGEVDPPPLSVDVVEEHLLPILGPSPVFLVVLGLYALGPMARDRSAPGFVLRDRGSRITTRSSPRPPRMRGTRSSVASSRTRSRGTTLAGGISRTMRAALNAFEDELLKEQLKRLTGRGHSGSLREDLHRPGRRSGTRPRPFGAQETPLRCRMVFNFVDLMTHGRSESPILMEVAKDEAALRGLTRAGSSDRPRSLFSRRRRAAGHQVIMTTDHGSILCQPPRPPSSHDGTPPATSGTSLA